jgi:mRNA-degrading endonuclease RelE of RelBE toxin-antitoxin system
MRTTVDIDPPILRDLKRLQKEEGKSLGRLVSELLAEAIGRRKAPARKSPPLKWNTTSGRLLVDLTDKEAVYEILDAELIRTRRR